MTGSTSRRTVLTAAIAVAVGAVAAPAAPAAVLAGAARPPKWGGARS
ncbi:hypothetical protein [Streptomyces albidochromogenes]